jgi:hypothetical protein
MTSSAVVGGKRAKRSKAKKAAGTKKRTVKRAGTKKRTVKRGGAKKKRRTTKKTTHHAKTTTRAKKPKRRTVKRGGRAGPSRDELEKQAKRLGIPLSKGGVRKTKSSLARAIARAH